MSNNFKVGQKITVIKKRLFKEPLRMSGVILGIYDASLEFWAGTVNEHIHVEIRLESGKKITADIGEDRKFYCRYSIVEL